MKTYNLSNPSNLFRSMLILISILLLSAVFMTPPVAALDWHTADQATVAWDAVTVNTDGGHLGAQDNVEYSVYLTDSTNPLKDSSTAVWRGSETQTLVTLSQEGSFYAGVRAHRIRDGTEVSISSVSWADDPVVTNDSPWGLLFFFPPASVKGIMKR
jgi:hypothetical protein